MVSLKLTIKAAGFHNISRILQEGFFIYGRCGITVRELLTEECRLDNQIINTKIMTVFLNSKPVDNIDKALIKKETVLALSGALPGLLGAIFRKDSIYSSFRGPISYKNEPENSIKEKSRCKIKIKLFNALIDELGTHFLQMGILIESESFLSFIKGLYSSFSQICSSILLNDEETHFEIFLKRTLLLKKTRYI